MIARDETGGLSESRIARRMRTRLSLIRRNLHLLRDADMATDAEESGEAFSTSNGPDGPIWKLLRKGEEYLAERSLL